MLPHYQLCMQREAELGAELAGGMAAMQRARQVSRRGRVAGVAGVMQLRCGTNAVQLPMIGQMACRGCHPALWQAASRLPCAWPPCGPCLQELAATHTPLHATLR